MIFLFEKYPYSESYLKDVLPINGKKSFVTLSDDPDNSKKKSIDAVGYVYNKDNKKSKDPSDKIVFILPKVFLDDVDESGNSKKKDIRAFGCNPEDISDIISSHKRFFSELALWVCSSIAKYRQMNPKVDDVDSPSPKGADYAKGSLLPTLMDVMNSMKQFYADNKNLFAFVSKTTHSGYNRVDWRRTINNKTAFWQNGSPIYMDVVNRRKAFDFDDRLLVLYFSAMNFIAETFGFDMPQSECYKPLKISEFNRLVGHKGLMELRRIKHKYFADKFLKLYNIMQAFFEWGDNFRSNGCADEYLLVKKYNNVFEHMIDTLIGSPVPQDMKYLKNQRDGKIIDHIYPYKPLLFAEEKEKIWFIGDSKYYSEGQHLSRGDIAKQYTYAKNIVQYHIFDAFRQGNEKELRYRDELTEGYNVTPNFFIRGFLPQFKKDNVGDNQFKDPFFISPTSDKDRDRQLISKEVNEKYYVDDFKEPVELWDLRNRHFVNRLFDRDTLLLQIYNINFLYVLKAFTSKRSGLAADIQTKARDLFRKDFLKLLDEKYAFWAVYPILNKWMLTDDEMNYNASLQVGDEKITPLSKFVTKHFRLLQGKIFRRNDVDDFVVMALERGASENVDILDKIKDDSDFVWLSVEDFVCDEELDPKEILELSEGSDGTWSEDKYGFILNYDAFVKKVRDNSVMPKKIHVQSGENVREYFLTGGHLPEYDVASDSISGWLLPCKAKDDFM